MNTTLYASSTHPPDIEGQRVLYIPAPDELRALALRDRLSLRIGLWLLQRAQRPRRSRSTAAFTTEALHHEQRHQSAAEMLAVATFDLQRQLR